MAVSGPTTNHKEIHHWAASHGAVPVEVLPRIVNSEPAVLRLMIADQIQDRSGVVPISWEEFFAKFDAQGLAFVYDTGSGPGNEILQRDEASAYRHPDHHPTKLQH